MRGREIKRNIALVIGISFFLSQLLFLRIYATVQLQKEKTPLRHEVEVTLKLIQVYVTDKKGNPVLDLKKEDFILLDNGKQQTITEFERHVLSLPSPKVEAQIEIAKETPLPAPRELMSRKFFLFFDFAYNNARGILKAREAGLHFIDTQLQPSDEVGVISYSALKSLTLHEYLTTDHQKVREVVKKFGIKEIAGRAEDFEAEYWRAVTGENPRDASRAGGVFQKEDDSYFLSQDRKASEFQVLNFAQKMTDLAKALRYIPGYKSILLFSSGVPYSLVYPIQSPYGDLRSGSWGESRLRLKYEEMLKELSASNCAVYALNTEESVATVNKDLRMTGSFTLQKVTSSTGGKYFGNIDNYQKHIEKIQNLTGCYYVIGYYIDEKWDGKYHTVKVNVRRPGCEVHAQKGYFSSKPFAEYAELEKMLHLVDLALSEKPLFQSPLRFPLGALSCSIGKEANLCLVSKIPVEEIQEGSKGKVEIVSLIFDAAGDNIEFRRAEKDISKLVNKHVYYYSYFSLSPGKYQGRVVMRNLETGRGAVATSAFGIAERPERGIQLFTTLLLSSEKGAFYLGGSLPKKKDGKDEFLSLADCFHFNPDQCSPFLDDVLQANSNIQAIVGYSIVDVPIPEVEISAYLVEKSSGQSVPLSLSILAEKEEKDLIMSFINIEIPEVPSGEYILKFVAEEKTSQSSSEVTHDIKVIYQDKGSVFYFFHLHTFFPLSVFLR
jgi:VWFA-related protein